MAPRKSRANCRVCPGSLKGVFRESRANSTVCPTSALRYMGNGRQAQKAWRKITNGSRNGHYVSRLVKNLRIKSNEQLFVLIGAVDRQTPAGQQDFECAPQSEHYVRKFSRRFEHAVLHHGRGARELIGRGCERVLH